MSAKDSKPVSLAKEQDISPLKELSYFKKLEKLEIGGDIDDVRLTSKDCDAISELIKLKILSLKNFSADGPYSSVFDRLKKGVEDYNAKVQDDQDKLEGLRELTLIEFPPFKAPAAAVYEAIGKLTELRTLTIELPRDAKSLQCLSSLTKLERLHINDIHPRYFDQKGFAGFLKALSHLRELQIKLTVQWQPSESLSDQLFEPIAQACEILTKLSFVSYQGEGQDFHLLAKLPKLERVEFIHARYLERNILESLDQFPKLSRLLLSYCDEIRQADVDEARKKLEGKLKIDFTPVEYYDDTTATEVDTDEES